MHDQARLLAKDLLNNMPPLAGGRMGKLGRSRIADKVSGEGAARRDINSIFGDLTGMDIFMNRRYGASREFSVISNEGVELVYKPDMTADEMRSVHDAARSPKTGRVTAAAKKRKHFVRPEVLSAFIKWRQSHVGRLRGGWINGYEQMSRKAMATMNPMGWVWRAAKSAERGLVSDTLDKDGTGQIGMTNNCTFAARNETAKRMTAIAMRVRDADMRKWARIRMERLIKRANSWRMKRAA
jgi:hypothetical protein